MLKIGLNDNLYVNRLVTHKTTEASKKSVAESVTTPVMNNNVAFKSNFTTLNTVLRDKNEKKMYSALLSNLSHANKENLEILLKSGKLLNNKSNNKTTTLENLHRIIKEKRLQGLDAKTVLNETVETLANPYKITQRFGDIPTKFVNEIIKNENSYLQQHPIREKNVLELLKNPQPNNSISSIDEYDLNVRSSCCPAASIEFTLADKHPAEFARMVSDLTSPELSSKKHLKLKTIAENMVDAFWLLNEFDTKYKAKDWENIEVECKPDRNAIIRARIQNRYKDKLERSVVDVLLQSTIMNIGSQHTYNSLIDKRGGKFSVENEGLTDIEKNFVESIILEKPTILVTYQKISDDMKISGYECDFKTMKEHIQNTINLGHNVIIGYSHINSEGRVEDGHEITIVDIKKGMDGKDYFVCNDTDDDLSQPIFYETESFLPKIHHAGLPKAALTGDVQFTEGWQEFLNEFKEMRNKKLAA